MEDWAVSRASGRCAQCDQELAERQEYYAVLSEVPTGFERKDLCLKCWQGPPEGHFCFWKSRVPVHEKKKRQIQVNDAVLISFFERLGREADPMRQRFRFVLALILMRKRLLRYEQTVRNDEQEHWQMRLAGTNAIHHVANPQMNDQQIAEVSQQIGFLLRGDVPDDLDEMLGTPSQTPWVDDVISEEKPPSQEQSVQ